MVLNCFKISLYVLFFGLRLILYDLFDFRAWLKFYVLTYSMVNQLHAIGT